MHNKNKLILSALMLTPLILTGCGDSKIDNDLEVVEEWTVAENEQEMDFIDKNNYDKKEESSNNLDKESNEKDDSKDTLEKDSIVNTNINTDKLEIKNETDSSDKSTSSVSNDGVTLVENPIFTKSEISEEVKSRMIGKSMPADATISFDELSYLTITYLDYNGKTKQGEMVVHKKLADEVLDIFKEIYNSKFPIERMRLVDDYGASDHTSMVNNNTSAFCYRTIAGTNKVSNHGKGVAIDINPFYNPHVLKSSGKVNPPEASKYADRSLNAKGMIKYNDVVYKAFTSRGWKWGGNWNNPDYQHFEKSI